MATAAPPAPRPWAAAACALAFLGAWAASSTAAGQALDEALLEGFDRLPGSREAWAAASWPGGTLVAAAVLAMAGLACLAMRELRAATAVAVCALVVPLVWGVKHAIGRARPDGALAEGMALPSGHAALATVAYGAVALVLVPALVRHGARPWLQPGATGLWLGLALAVGVARVAAGVHWPTDVVAGWAFGGLVLAVATAMAGPGRREAAPTQPAL